MERWAPRAVDELEAQVEHGGDEPAEEEGEGGEAEEGCWGGWHGCEMGLVVVQVLYKYCTIMWVAEGRDVWMDECQWRVGAWFFYLIWSLAWRGGVTEWENCGDLRSERFRGGQTHDAAVDIGILYVVEGTVYIRDSTWIAEQHNVEFWGFFFKYIIHLPYFSGQNDQILLSHTWHESFASLHIHPSSIYTTLPMLIAILHDIPLLTLNPPQQIIAHP